MAASLMTWPWSWELSLRPSISSQSIRTPEAARIRRTAVATSGPMPSPAISVTLCLMVASYCRRGGAACRKTCQLQLLLGNRLASTTNRLLLYCLSSLRRGERLRAEAFRIMISLTPVASTKVKEIMSMQTPVPVALRVAVVGGGCSGFQYHMAFENATSEADEVVDFNGLKVAVDQMSSMYLDGVEIDYIETVEGAGFKFNNPNVKSTCGCGSSFSV